MRVNRPAFETPEAGREDRQFSARYWREALRWFVILLLSLELLARVLLVRAPILEYEPGWGVVPIADSYSMQGREGFAVTHYHEHGEVETPFRGPATISVVVLGDSTVQAAHVPNEKNFVSLAETSLRRQGIPVDFKNLARSRRSIADHVYIAPALNAAFFPDYLIVQVNFTNFALSYYPTQENRFIEDGLGGQAFLHRASNEAEYLALQNLLKRSSLFAFAELRLKTLLEGVPVGLARLISNETGALESPAVISALQGDYESKILAQVGALQAAYPHSRIIFLVIPYAPTVTWQEKLDINWMSKNDEELARVLASVDGVHVLNARDAFAGFYQEYNVFPRGTFNTAFNFGHLNEHGHLAVAQALAELMERLLR